MYWTEDPEIVEMRKRDGWGQFNKALGRCGLTVTDERHEGAEWSVTFYAIVGRHGETRIYRQYILEAHGRTILLALADGVTRIPQSLLWRPVSVETRLWLLYMLADEVS